MSRREEWMVAFLAEPPDKPPRRLALRVALRATVAGWLAAQARHDGTHALPPTSAVAAVAGVSVRTLQRVTADLLAEGWLVLRERGHYRHGGKSTANVYDLSVPEALRATYAWREEPEALQDSQEWREEESSSRHEPGSSRHEARGLSSPSSLREDPGAARRPDAPTPAGAGARPDAAGAASTGPVPAGSFSAAIIRRLVERGFDEGAVREWLEEYDEHQAVKLLRLEDREIRARLEVYGA